MTEPAVRHLEGPIRSVGVVYRAKTPEVMGIIDRLAQWAAEQEISVAVEQTEDGVEFGVAVLPVISTIVGGDADRARAYAHIAVGRAEHVVACEGVTVETGLPALGRAADPDGHRSGRSRAVDAVRPAARPHMTASSTGSSR